VTDLHLVGAKHLYSAGSKRAPRELGRLNVGRLSMGRESVESTSILFHSLAGTGTMTLSKQSSPLSAQYSLTDMIDAGGSPACRSAMRCWN
jgi:hypothetical protein